MKGRVPAMKQVPSDGTKNDDQVYAFVGEAGNKKSCSSNRRKSPLREGREKRANKRRILERPKN